MKKAVLFICCTFCFYYGFGRHIDTNAPTNNINLIETEEGVTGNIKIENTDSSAYALVAGGSRGIGFSIAEALAKRGYNLILVARGMDDLVAAKDKLQITYGIHVEILSFDLSKEQTATQIANWCIEKGIKLKILCNVAGLGGDKDYLSLPLDSLRYMIRLNVESAMAMSLTLLPLLEKNTPAYILNVASMAGFAPIPSKNIYAATKSAVISFSYSLRYQLKEKNISVSCLAPGPVYTKPSIEKETKRQLGWLGDKMAVEPKKVGEITVKKMLKGRPMIVPGTIARFLSGVLRILPKRTTTYIYGKAGDRSERKSTQ